MKDESKHHHRRSVRLPRYDYAQAGAYFVTVCVQNRRCLFGKVVDGRMQLNDAGRIVECVWHGLQKRFLHIVVDAHVVMPNHVHGIIFVGAQFIAPETAGNYMGAMNRAITDDVARGGRGDSCHKTTINRAPTVGEIVRTFKAIATRYIRQNGMDGFAWQRNYHEHIIRNQAALDRIRKYIMNNPLQWALDSENPSNAGAERAMSLQQKPWK